MKDVQTLLLITLTAAVVYVLLDPYRAWSARNKAFIEWVRENRANKFSPSDLRAMYRLNTRPISLDDAPFFFDKYVAAVKAQ